MRPRPTPGSGEGVAAPDTCSKAEGLPSALLSLSAEEVRLVWVALSSLVGTVSTEFLLSDTEWSQACALFERLNDFINQGDRRTWVVRCHDMWSMGSGLISSLDGARRMSTAMAASAAAVLRRNGYQDVTMIEVDGPPDPLTKQAPPWQEVG